MLFFFCLPFVIYCGKMYYGDKNERENRKNV